MPLRPPDATRSSSCWCGAAAMSPSGDPFNFALVAIPLVVLYEMSILVVRLSATSAARATRPCPRPSQHLTRPTWGRAARRAPERRRARRRPGGEHGRTHRSPAPRIDELNLDLLRTLSERAAVAEAIGRLQTEVGLSHYDPMREQQHARRPRGGEPGTLQRRDRQEPVQAGLPGIDAARAGAGQGPVPDLAPAPREDTVVWVGDVPSAATTPGPHRRTVRDRVARAGDGDRCARRARGVKLFRGGAFKPRTDPYSFQGLGVEGLEFGREACDEHGLHFVAEIMDAADLAGVRAPRRRDPDRRAQHAELHGSSRRRALAPTRCCSSAVSPPRSRSG
jgi:hypothetical protein